MRERGFKGDKLVCAWEKTLVELLIGKTKEETGSSHSREGLFQNEGKKQSTTILALFNWTLKTIPCVDATIATCYLR